MKTRPSHWLTRNLLGFCILFATFAAGAADDDGWKTVGGNVRYHSLGEYDVGQLNKILTTELAEFSDLSVEYPPATNAVELYKVTYDTVIPEDANRPVRVSGLIAVPKTADKSLPVVSYQHGTVFSRDEVPSVFEKSPETRLAVARFAGSGYAVIAADYIGKGDSEEPDAWMVKESAAQVCVDMLSAARAVFADLGITPAELFLSGWSQGTFTSAAFLRRLENTGVPVAAAGLAAAPNDIYLCVNRWIHVPSPLDVNWLVGAAALLIHSYETYYKFPGLAAVAIKPEYRETAENLYRNKVDWTTAAKTLPPSVKELFREEFIRRNSPIAEHFLRQLQANSSYNWRFRTPVYYYYGDLDEVMTPYMVQLPVEYQKALGGVPPQAFSAGKKANHRGAYVYGLADQKKRFDAQLADKP